MPADLQQAIDHALKVLGWHEGGLSKDEIPPSWMWHLDHELETWWIEVERRRDSQSSPTGAVEEAPMEENLFAARLRGK